MRDDTLRVLLVDSEQCSREQLAAFLCEHGPFEVDIATDGAQAWEVIQSGKNYHVVLLDELLPATANATPQCIGIDLMKKIKEYCPPIEVILFRARGIISSLATALDAGAFRYVDKSMDRKNLVVLIERTAASQKLRQDAREKDILARLMETNAALLGAQSEQEVLESILHGIHQALKFDRVRLYTFDGQNMYGKAQVGMSDDFRTVVRPVANDIYMQDLLADLRPHVCKRKQDRDLPFEELLDKEDVNEWICLPLLHKGEVLGALSADNKKSQRPIRNEELGPVALFASQAAVALANVRLFEEMKRQAEQLEALRRTTLAITSPLEREGLLRTILAHAVELLKAKGGGFYKYYPEREELEIIADHTRPSSVGRTMKVGEGIAGRLVQNPQPYRIVENYYESPERIRDWPDDTLFGALLEVPLAWQGQILGVLFVGDDIGRTFTQNDAHLLRLFADHATIALVNAELVAKEEIKSQLLEKLSRAIKEVTGELGRTTVQQHLELIAKHAAEILGAEASGVLLKQPSGRLRFEAGYGHRPESHEVGKEYLILSGRRKGLTSHIAYEGIPFRKHGKELKEHWASDGDPPDHLPSGPRCSMMVLPLKKQVGNQEQLVGLIRVENKRGKDGEPLPTVGFSEEDEWILNIFAEAAVVAIESVGLVNALQEQKEVAKAARERLHTSFQASSKLLSSQKPDEVLREIVEQARVAADASGVRVILRDEEGKPKVEVATPAPYQTSYHIRWPDGISWKAMSTGEPQIILNTDTASQKININPDLLQEGTKAFCCMPLSLQGEAIGVMSFYYKDPCDFLDYEIDALKLYANQAAAAYDSAQRMAKLEHLRRAVEVLAGANSLPEVLQQIAHNAREVLQADVVDVWPYDEVQERFMVEEMLSTGTIYALQRPLLHKDGLWEPVMKSVMTQQGVGIADLTDARTEILPEAVRQHLLMWRIQRLQGLILTAGDEKLGVLVMYYRVARHFSEEEWKTARTFANHAALALKQAMLLDQVSKAKRAAEVVARVTALRGSEVTLEAIAQGTREAVGCDAVTLYVYKQGGNGVTHSISEPSPRVIGVTYHKHVEHLPEVEPGPLLSAFLSYDDSSVVENSLPELLTQEFEKEWLLVLPLRVAKKKIGVMLIKYCTPHRFAPDERSNLERFARQVAVASWEVARTVLRAGALDYIDKSTSTQVLRAIVKHMLDGQNDSLLALM